MLSPNMPRPLIPLLFALSILAGCAVPPPQPSVGDQPTDVVTHADLTKWLDLQQEVEGMDPAEVASRLASVDRSTDTDQLYYYGVLNQQLKDYGAWTVARDTFQKLQENQALPKEKRQLAGILRQYNQNRINWYSRHHALLDERAQLQLELDRAEEEKRQLAQKIQALTELEAAISTRREE
jgi:hypothetical protein